MIGQMTAPSAPMMSFPRPKFRKLRFQVIADKGHRVRPERHNPHSIATIHIELAHQLLQQLPHCPFCGSPPG